MIKYCLMFFWIISACRGLAQSGLDGILDLRNNDLTYPVSLAGEYDFYWNVLSSSGEKLDTLKKEVVRFPGLWNDVTLNGEKLGPFGYATYRLKILLPEKNVHYAAIIEDMYCAYALYQSGMLLATNGKVAADEAGYEPEWRSQKVDFYQEHGDTLDLILQISNFEHSKGGALEGITFGEKSSIEKLYLSQISYDLLLTGCLIMGGLFFLGLYLFGRHEPAILYFSLFCLTYSYRIIGTNHYELHSLVENYPWWFAVRMEYITLFVSVMLFSKFLLRLFPEETSRNVANGLVWGSLAFVAATLLLPLYYFSQIIEPFFILLLTAFVYTIWVYIKAWKRRRPGSEYALASTLVALSVFSYNITDYFGIIEINDVLSFWGYVAFFFSQSLLLSHRFAFSLKKAKEKAEIASEAKTDFLSTISHEIRTPLNAIVGMSHIMLKNDPREDQVQKLESLTFSAENLTSLINDILDFNKIESGSIVLEALPINLSDHASKIIKGYEGQATNKGVALSLSSDPKIFGRLMADPVRIAQVLNNLINNALKFTKQGSIEVILELLRDTKDSQVVDVRIKDTGEGIHKDKMDLIFEKFTQASSSTTREFGGTGLGLSIVRGILNLYGSQINVTSQLGIGSVFSFEIKLEKGKNKNEGFDLEVSKENRLELDDIAVLTGKKVLVVEDNVMNMMIAEEFLTRWGMILSKAENGKEACDLAAEESFDLVLMDLHMPIMDGYEASRRIHELIPDLPIVALTASTIAEQQEQIKSAGMKGYVLKPFHPKDLRSKLTQVLSD